MPTPLVESLTRRDSWRESQAANSRPLEFLVSDLRRWIPGSVVRVAFLDGDAGLHQKVADACEQIADQCNLTLDFGLDRTSGEFRRWLESDTAYAAEIRVSFDLDGYWSLVGTDSTDPTVGRPQDPYGGGPSKRSLNLGGFTDLLPEGWKGTVRHEFLHALAFEHEHQNPRGSCESEMRWADDPGYVPTTNSSGVFVPDGAGNRPGIYTYLSGPPNNWSRAQIDHNLRTGDSPRSSASGFDSESVMLYRFEDFFYSSPDSACIPDGDGVNLSDGDKRGLALLYPQVGPEATALGSRAQEASAALARQAALEATAGGATSAYVRRAQELLANMVAALSSTGTVPRLTARSRTAFDRQVGNTIERALAEPTREVPAAQLAEAVARGEVPAPEVEDPLRIATRAVTSGIAPTVGTLLAPADGTPTADALAVVYERVLGKSNFLGSRFLFTGAARAEAVCRVVIRSASGAVAGYGTGFLVSPTAVMTNNHVLGDEEVAANSVVQFGYRESNGGTMHPVSEYALDPRTLFATDQPLDFTIVAVQPSSFTGTKLASHGWVPLIGPSGKSLVGERVNIIQHPSGEPQQAVVHDNTIVDVVGDYLRYVADTQPGSSGSPVFNNNWDLAALHHSGVPRIDDQGRILLTNGDVWDGSAATRDLIDWVSNEGVRISSIVEHLKALPQTVELAQILNPPAAPGAPHAMGGESASLGAVGGPTVRGGVARWEIPLTVELDVPGVSHPGEPVPGPQPVAAPEEYYDETADTHAANAYYANIDPDADPGERYGQLHELLAATHSVVLSYRTARLDHLYPTVDLHPDGLLHSVYSDQAHDPQEIIAADLLIESQSTARLGELLAQESSLSTETAQAIIASVEAQFSFNCEHVVPQSWFDKQQPMRADLHHLFTCESGCNSFRGNIAYWDFPPEQEAIRTNCGQLQGRRFEPDAHHGAVARATLYFLIRYPKLVAPTEAEMPAERVEILLDWHNENPPSLWEKHRNAAIAAAQGNRNPLIDHPDWASHIDYGHGFAS